MKTFKNIIRPRGLQTFNNKKARCIRTYPRFNLKEKHDYFELCALHGYEVMAGTRRNIFITMRHHLETHNDRIGLVIKNGIVNYIGHNRDDGRLNRKMDIFFCSHGKKIALYNIITRKSGHEYDAIPFLDLLIKNPQLCDKFFYNRLTNIQPDPRPDFKSPDYKYNKTKILLYTKKIQIFTCVQNKGWKLVDAMKNHDKCYYCKKHAAIETLGGTAKDIQILRVLHANICDNINSATYGKALENGNLINLKSCQNNNTEDVVLMRNNEKIVVASEISSVVAGLLVKTLQQHGDLCDKIFLSDVNQTKLLVYMKD